MMSITTLAALLFAVASLATTTTATAATAGSCFTFYRDLCVGPYSCMCTLREPCGTARLNVTEAKRLGGCTGHCRQVEHDRCRGPDSCMKDVGECVIPTASPPNPNMMLGVDFASAKSKDTIDCLVKHNRTFGIVRAHHSNGGVDTNAVPMIKRMRAAGMKKVDAYLFPCTTFASGHGPREQVNATVEYLLANGARPDRVWFDIEWNTMDPACAWKPDNKSSNCEFVKGLVEGATHATSKHQVPFGFYAGKTFWSEFLGSCDAGKDLPLWYAAYDNIKSFQDWTSYGGWTAPSVKQYTDKLELCGDTWDSDWAPNGLP